MTNSPSDLKPPFNLYRVGDEMVVNEKILEVERRFPVHVQANGRARPKQIQAWLNNLNIEFEWSLGGLYCFKDKGTASLFKLTWG